MSVKQSIYEESAKMPPSRRFITTSRLILRSPIYADGPNLHAPLSDPVLCRYSPNPVVSDPAFTQFVIVDWDERREAGLLTYVIAEKIDQARAIGFISVSADEELGGVLSNQASGRGFASEALREVISAHNMRRAWTIIDAEHKLLIQTLGKVGLFVEKRLAACRVHPQISDQKRDCVLLRQRS